VGERGARGGENPCEIPLQNKVREGRRCVAVTSDSRASCRRRRLLTDGVFYDRVAAALQGLGGRTLETPRSFLAADIAPIALREIRFFRALFLLAISLTIFKFSRALFEYLLNRFIHIHMIEQKIGNK